MSNGRIIEKLDIKYDTIQLNEYEVKNFTHD